MNIGDKIITSHGRIGTILSINSINGVEKALVQIGEKQVTILTKELINHKSTHQAYAEYTTDGGYEIVKQIVHLNIGLVIFDFNNHFTLADTIRDIAKSKIVKITKASEKDVKILKVTLI